MPAHAPLYRMTRHTAMTVLVVNNDRSVRNPRGFSYFCMCRKRSRVILFVAYKNDGLNSSPLSSFKQIKIRGVLAALWRWECKVGGCRDLKIRKTISSVQIWTQVNFFNRNDLRHEMTLDLQWSYSKALSHSACMHAKSRESCLILFETVARQAPLSLEFSRQEYRSELLCPPLGDLPNPGIEPGSPRSPSLAGGFFTTSTTWETLLSLQGTWMPSRECTDLTDTSDKV